MNHLWRKKRRFWSDKFWIFIGNWYLESSSYVTRLMLKILEFFSENSERWNHLSHIPIFQRVDTSFKTRKRFVTKAVKIDGPVLEAQSFELENVIESLMRSLRKQISALFLNLFLYAAWGIELCWKQGKEEVKP